MRGVANPGNTDRYERIDGDPSRRGSHTHKDKDERERSGADAKKLLKAHARLQRTNRNGKKHLSV